MIEDAYHVVVPQALAERWDTLPERHHSLLADRLDRAARAAHAEPTRWRDGEPGAHRGRHRAVLGGLWLLYQVDDDQRAVHLVGFGEVLRRGGAGR